MAVVATHLTTDRSAASAASYATASITPTANRLVLAAVYHRNGASSVATPTASGCGLTWVQVATRADSSGEMRIILFRALGASPSSGAVTFDFGGQTQTQCNWSIAEFAGVVTTGSNGADAVVQSATAIDETDAVTSLTVTLAAFASASNGTYGAFRDGNAMTVGSGFTELGQTSSGRIMSEFKNSSDTSVDCTFTTGSHSLGIAVEIAAASTASSNSGFFAVL